MMLARLLLAAAAGIMAIALAWNASAQMQGDTRKPDSKRGGVIAAQGTATGAAACAQCHAINGASNGSGAFPRIAGQSVYYLSKQLRDFTSDVRVSAVMSPIAKALTPDDIADVAAYYAGVSAPFLPLRNSDPTLISRGKELAKVGSASKRIPACDNCHGPSGVGEPPAIPYLAGQYAAYIVSELRMWQQGVRKSSPESMAEVARSRQSLPITSKRGDPHSRPRIRT
jgi:cytochrome c553